MRKRLAIAGAAAVAAAALVATVLVLRGGESGPAKSEAVVASTSVSPRLPAFGDRVTADLRVRVDRRQADPRSVRVTARFTPYRPLGPPAQRKSASGEMTVLRYRYVLDCLERACLPRGKLFLFPSARVTYRGGEVSATWPDVRLETRGSGHATRQIRHLVTPEFPADRLLIVEVVTPAGNWSSWPPHKHDVDAMPDEAVLEEIYHYRFRRSEAWAIQRLYRRPERGLPPRDALWAVRDGEVVLVTDGYHPFSATTADDAFYLNALAGDQRTMACSFDPDFV
jgi:hypothetical protein